MRRAETAKKARFPRYSETGVRAQSFMCERRAASARTRRTNASSAASGPWQESPAQTDPAASTQVRTTISRLFTSGVNKSVRSSCASTNDCFTFSEHPWISHQSMSARHTGDEFRVSLHAPGPDHGRRRNALRAARKEADERIRFARSGHKSPSLNGA